MIVSADRIVNNVAQMQTRVIAVFTLGTFRYLNATGFHTIIVESLCLAIARMSSDIALAKLATIRIVGALDGYVIRLMNGTISLYTNGTSNHDSTDKCWYANFFHKFLLSKNALHTKITIQTSIFS